MRLLRYLKPFFKQHMISYALGIIVLIIVDIIQLMPLKIVGIVTDKLLAGNANLNTLLYYSLLILALAIAMTICRFLWRYLIIGTSRKLENWLRKQMFDHILSLPTEFFDNHPTGNLTALCTNDIRAMRMSFGIGTVMLIDALFMSIIVSFTMFLSIDKKLTLLAILPLPFIAISVFVMGKAIKTRFFTVQDNFGLLTNKTQESLSGIRVTKAFATEQIDLDDFENYNLGSYKAYISLAKFDSALYPTVQFISSISLVIALTYGGYLVTQHIITIGSLLTFLGYLAKLTWPMMATGYVFNIIQRAMVSMSRIADLLEQKTDDTAPPVSTIHTDKKSKHTINSIRFEDVSFSYNDTAASVLNNISFTLHANQTLGIIGRTGCGKSTIPKLILKLYPPTSGMIYFDDIPITDIPDTILRNQISFVPQETFLFSKSIKENITFYNENITDDDIISASKLAKFHEEVLSFSNGYNTQLGERGVNLSGGQKQRLSIARALLRNSPILILDDSLSAVDSNTEKYILQNIKQTTSDKQTIIISHRISTISHADFIIVLENGHIIESGNHLELIDKQGLYYKLYQQQSKEEELGVL